MPGCEKCNDTGTIAIRARDGTTPNAPGAKFKTGDVVTVIPLGFSPDWAWADTLGNPRPLMCQVGARHVTYIVAFEGDPRPTLLREKYLLPTREPSAEMRLSYDR
jgi:hypothetical protein